jgi:hypothetical protein
MPTSFRPLVPQTYAEVPVAQLLDEAGKGRLSLDQRLIEALISRPDEAAQAILAYGISQLPVDAALAMPYVTQLLREGLEEVPESLIAIARRAGAAAVGDLVDVYRQTEEDVAGEIAFILAALGQRDPRILEILHERLEFDMEDGAMLLGLYGDPAGIPALENVLGEVDKNREVEFALQQLREQAPAGDDSPAMDFLEDYPAVGLPIFGVLPEEEILEIALGSTDEEARLEALDILEDLDLGASAAPRLLALAQDADAPVLWRAGAWRALHRMVQISEVRLAALELAIDPSALPALRAAALVCLLPQYGMAEAPALIEELLHVPEARPDAAQAMWRSRDPRYAFAFGPLLNDPDLEVRRQATRGIGVFADKTQLVPLRALFADQDLREDALFSYAMAVPSDISPSRVRSLLKRIEEEAGGLLQSETTAVCIALDMRLEAAGKAPVFFREGEED